MADETPNAAPELAGITTIEQAEKQVGPVETPIVSAKAAFGLEETPRESLRREEEKLKANVPVEKIPRDESGRFVSPPKAEKPKPAAPKTTKPAPAQKPPAAAAAPAPATEPAKKDEKPAAAAAPEPTKKVKIGDKEYTVEELEKALAEKQKPAAAPAQPAAPAAPEAPTPEEIAQLEDQYVGELAAKIADANITEDGLEKILVGGKDGVAALQNLLKGAAARAVLEARKSIYAELNPVIAQLDHRVAPLVQDHQQIERIATEMAFKTAYPEYTGPHLETARYVAEQLLSQYPQHVAQMSREQFLAEVDRQSDRIISSEFKRWNPEYQGTWRDYVKSKNAPAAAAPATPPATPPASPALTATPGTPPAPAKPAAPSKPAVKPPAGNSPGAVGGAPKDWQKSVAGSLVA